MDIIKNTKKELSEEYLASCQLAELIGDIERCATMLVTAAKKARENCERNKHKYIQDLSSINS